MRAGKLDQRITVQTNTPTTDSKGQKIESWADTKTIWAGAVTDGGKEFFAAQKVYSEAQVVFRVRYDSSIVSTQRIKWLSRYYSILGINPVNGQYRELLLTCKEVV